VGKGARLAHQLVDDVSILDAVAPFATQSWDSLQVALGLVDVEVICVQADPHALAVEATVH